MSFFSPLRRWWHQGQTCRANQRPTSRHLLDFDALETRILPSATPFAVPSGFTPDSATLGDNLTNEKIITLEGQGTADTLFNLYANNAFVTRGTVGSDGTWTLKVPRTLGTTTYNFKTVPTTNNDPIASGTIAITIDLLKPVVMLTPQAFVVGSMPKVSVKATDVGGTDQVAIDVDMNGNRKIETTEMNNVVAPIVSGQATILTLASFPNLPTVYLRARVVDKAGNETTGNLISMKGPQPNKVTLSVPASTSAAVYHANLTVAAGLNNGYQTGISVDVDLNQNNLFEANEEYVSGTLDGMGKATLSMSGLVAGTYKVRGRSTDLYGNTVVSTTQTMVVKDIGSANAQPLIFEPNVGQVVVPSGQSDPGVQFVARLKNGPPAYLSSNTVTLQVPVQDSQGAVALAAQRMVLANGGAGIQGVGQEAQSSYSSYYVHGSTLPRIANYGQVLFAGVYDKIDVRYRGDVGILAYDFIVHPGGNANDIALTFPDAASITMDSLGQLVLAVGDGQTITHGLPITYQIGAGGVKQAVPSQFTMNGGQVGFRVGAYDTARSLYIDPYVFVDFLVSSGNDTAEGLTQDSQGNLFFIGTAGGANYPEIPAPPVSNNQALNDVVVTKLTSGGQIIWSVYIGGDRADFGGGIAVDASGYVYITGQTASIFGGAGAVPFPTSLNTFPPASISPEAFVTILKPDGSIFQSTLLGGNGTETGVAIALDGSENIWITGNSSGITAIAGFPAPTSSLGSVVGSHIFLTKFSRRDLVTGYLFTLGIGGGIFTDTVNSMVIDGLDRIYLVGDTANGGFPITTNAYVSTLPSFFGSGYVVRLADNGNLPPTQTYGTFIGGTNTGIAAIPASDATGLAVDANFDIYVTGTTNTNDFFTPPLTTGLKTTRFVTQSDDDAYILKLHVDTLATTATTGTYFGSAFRDDSGVSIALDFKRNIYLYGEVNKVAADVSAPAIYNLKPAQSYLPGNDVDAFIAIVNATATQQILGTTIGGSGDETVSPNGFVVDPSATMFFAGSTDDVASFQAQIQSGTTAILGNSGIPAPTDIYVGSISRAVGQTLFQDVFEANDTSNVAKNIDRFVNGGSIPNLTTARHSSGLFDYDWYKYTPTQAGTLTISLTNIFVFASGPKATFGIGGDLHLFAYRQVNGFLYEAKRSTISGSGLQRVAINVSAGEKIVFLVNPFNYTQASYTMRITLA